MLLKLSSSCSSLDYLFTKASLILLEFASLKDDDDGERGASFRWKSFVPFSNSRDQISITFKGGAIKVGFVVASCPPFL